MKIILLIISVIVLLSIFSFIIIITPFNTRISPYPIKPLNVKNHIFLSSNISLPHINTSAPIGIADYGISPNGSFSRETTQWLGTVYVQSLSATSNLNNSYDHAVSFQLNVVLNYEHNNKTYALWIQDVAEYNTITHGLYFSDNVWNLSGEYVYVIGKLSYIIGNPSNITFGQYYGYLDPSSFNYNNGMPKIITNTSFNFELLVNISTNSQDEPVIHIWYNYENKWNNFDNIIIPAPNSSNIYFLIDGYNHTPNGLYYDSALVMGGAYSGSVANMTNGTVLLQLFYWNGYNFQEVKNAYDVGYDTGETIKNAFIQPYVYNGEIYAKITVGKEDPNIFLWNQNNMTNLISNSSKENQSLDLKINLINNGYLTIYFPNGSKENITESTFLKVKNNTCITVTSSMPFIINNDKIIVNYFSEDIHTNTIWNITFYSLIPQGYVNVTVTVNGQGHLNIIIYNHTTNLTIISINHTRTFFVPKGYYITFYSYQNQFMVIENGKAPYIFNKLYFTNNKDINSMFNNYFYGGLITQNMIINIIFLLGTDNTLISNNVSSTYIVNVELSNTDNEMTVNSLVILFIIMLISFLIHVFIKEIRKNTN